MANIIKYGTLKTSSRNYIENRLSIILAGLIAFIDQNNNLDTFVKPEKEWITKYWFEFFKTKCFVNIEYTKYYLQPNGTEKTEFNCRNAFSIANNRHNGGRLQLPFSWLIKEFLDDFISKQKSCLQNSFNDNQDSDTDINNNLSLVFQQIVNILNTTNQFEALNSILTDNSIDIVEFIFLYLNDYILLSHEQILNEDHLNIFKKRILQFIAFNYCKKFNSINVLVAIHMSFNDLRNEVELLSQFIHYDPSVLKILLKNDSENINLCFVASKVICDKITKFTANMGISEWNKWFTIVSNGSYLIEKYLKLFIHPSLSSSTLHNNNNNIEQSLMQFTSLWERVIVIKLFIQHVCTSKAQHMYSYCIRLWGFIKDPTNFKTKSTLDDLITFKSTILKGQETGVLKQSKQVCKGCGANRINETVYITSKCNCILCLKCRNNFESSNSCPGCNKDQHRANVTFTELPLEAEKENFIAFKNSMDIFFLDVVSTLCFNESELPRNEVIDTLIAQILPKVKTRADEIDLNANIKSTLLQLLLKYKSANVEQCLQDLFNKSANILTKNYDYNDLADLKLMYINAIEDNFCSTNLESTERSINIDAATTMNFLDELTRHNSSFDNDNDISSLRIIATIKFCLVTCARLVNIYDDRNIHQKEFMKRTNEFLESYQSGWPRFFLIKQIFRRYGKACFGKIIKYDHLKWILPSYLAQNFNMVNF